MNTGSNFRSNPKSFNRVVTKFIVHLLCTYIIVRQGLKIHVNRKHLHWFNQSHWKSIFNSFTSVYPTHNHSLTYQT